MLGNLKKISVKESLSARLLLFTFFFVLIAEVVIYVPSIATFRENWINQKLAEANIAILVIEAAPDFMVSRLLADELLSSTENYSIVRTFEGAEDFPQADGETVRGRARRGGPRGCPCPCTARARRWAGCHR